MTDKINKTISTKETSFQILHFKNAWMLAEVIRLIENPPSRQRKKTLKKVIKKSEKEADIT